MRWLFEQIGVDPAYMKFSAFNNTDGSPYRLGEVPHRDNSEWNFFIERGDTGRDAFNKLLRVAADSVYGTHPGQFGTELWFKKVSDLDTEPKVTLYRRIQDALDAMPSLAEEDAYKFVYSSFSEEVLDAEGNEIRVIGIDPRTGNIIIAYIINEEMQDPTIAPTLRVPGWSGTRKAIGYQSRNVRTLADAERIIESLVPIVMNQNKLCEWGGHDLVPYDSGFGQTFPLWRMDTARLMGAAKDGSDIDRLVSGFSSASRLESSDLTVRDTTYTGGTIVGRGGRTLAEIQNNARMRNQQLGIKDFTPPFTPFSAPKSIVQVLVSP